MSSNLNARCAALDSESKGYLVICESKSRLSYLQVVSIRFFEQFNVFTLGWPAGIADVELELERATP